MKVQWATAEPPLPVVAVAARSGAAHRLQAKADRKTDWVITRFDEWIVVVGDDLPWVEDAVYLGHLHGATHVLVPVHRRPQLHPELVDRVTAAFRGTARLAALIPSGDGVTVLPLADS